MLFRKFLPSEKIKHLIECYWVMEDDDMKPRQQKIIPDGFPEIIFHYGDPFKILITKEWQRQQQYLFAGQITKYFFLENSGKTGVLGIKLKPAAFTCLFNISMKSFTDRVVPLNDVLPAKFEELKQWLPPGLHHKEIITRLNEYFEKLSADTKDDFNGINKAIKLVFEKNGIIKMQELCRAAALGERQLLNQFNYYVGLSPKIYARIIRLNYIFQLVQKKEDKWTSLAYEAAFFDQAHFIKDFKTFTGEKPSKYAFGEKNMANFFLLK